MTEIEALQQEVAALRAELDALKAALNISSDASSGAPHLRCASLRVEEPSGRFALTLAAGEGGPSLRLLDARAGESGTLAELTSTPEGAGLALSGHDGVPRVILTARDEGGGVSLVDAAANLAAEVWGARDVSWVILHHDGQPALLALGGPDGGRLELFDAQSTLRAALPPALAEVATRELGEQSARGEGVPTPPAI